MVTLMKKIEGENWISAARAMAPTISVPLSVRSATLAPRPRFAGTPRGGHGAQLAG
jgi:hypothetical protein